MKNTLRFFTSNVKQLYLNISILFKRGYIDLVKGLKINLTKGI